MEHTQDARIPTLYLSKNCVRAYVRARFRHTVEQRQQYRKQRRRTGGLNAKVIEVEPATYFKTVVQKNGTASLLLT
jgi:hypothetical protein